MLGVDVDRFLDDEVEFFALGQRLDGPVGAINDQLQFLVLAGVEVFLELAALALEITVLIDQLLLTRRTLAFCQGRCVALEPV